jgi:hypothetical protein
VPADPSSSIPAALAQLAHADPLGPAEPPHLLAYLATLHDPRRACGRRHPPVAILAMAAAAVLAGARSMAAIAEWAADAPQPVRAALGARRDAPDRWVVPAEATIRRTLVRVDPDLLAAVIGAWLADRGRPGQRRRAVAVDGKTLRGARCDGRQVHLLAAMDHATRAVLAQRQVNGAPGWVPGFPPLLGDLDLTGTVVTADALHTHGDVAEFLVTGKQAHYLFVVKANQPTCWTAAPAWPGTTSRPGPHPRPRPRPGRAAHPQGRLGRWVRVSAHRLGPPGHPQDPRPAQSTVADRGRLRGHQPHPRPGQPRPAGRPPAGALDDRERPALGAGCDLRRGPPPSCAPAAARRSWPACATSPSARCAAPGRSTSPPPSASTPATHAAPWPPSITLG